MFAKHFPRYWLRFAKERLREESLCNSWSTQDLASRGRNTGTKEEPDTHVVNNWNAGSQETKSSASTVRPYRPSHSA